MLCKAGDRRWIDVRGGSSEPAPAPAPAPGARPCACSRGRILRRMSITGFPKRQRRLFTTISVGFAALIFKGNEAGHLKNHALAGEGVGNAYPSPVGTETVNTGRYYCSCGEWK